MRTTHGLAIAAFLLTSGTVASAQVNCLAPPFNGTINVAVNSSVFAANGNCLIGAAGSVNGTIQQTGAGSVTVRGAVNGDVFEAGGGNVIVTATGSVNGSISEMDAGLVRVTVGAGRVANLNVDEAGRLRIRRHPGLARAGAAARSTSMPRCGGGLSPRPPCRGRSGAGSPR